MTKKRDPQVEKFRELARQLGTDDSEAAFEARLKAIAAAPAAPKSAPKAKRATPPPKRQS